MRRAAEAGLKSARLAYVDNAVGGRWSDCGVVLDADQVSGYYENMLLGALRRELAGLISP